MQEYGNLSPPQAKNFEFFTSTVEKYTKIWRLVDLFRIFALDYRILGTPSLHTGLETVILKNQKMAKIAEKWPFLGGFSYILFNFGHFLSIIYSARIGMVLAVPLPQIKCPKYKDIPRPDAQQGFNGESLGKMANFCQNWHILRSKFLKFRYLRPK